MSNIPNDFIEQIYQKLSTYFLHTTYTNTPVLKDEIVKHLGIDEKNVSFEKADEVKNDEKKETGVIYILTIFDCPFRLLFEKRLTAPKEKKVPKVVKVEKKWWELRKPDVETIEEIVKIEEKEYWILESISSL